MVVSLTTGATLSYLSELEKKLDIKNYIFRDLDNMNFWPIQLCDPSPDCSSHRGGDLDILDRPLPQVGNTNLPCYKNDKTNLD